MIKTRIATPFDFDAIVELCMERAKEFTFEKFPEPNPEYILHNVKRNYLNAPCFILEKDGEIIGFAGCSLDDYFWSAEKYLSDYMVFIKPEHRNIKLAKKLYSAIIEFANLHGLPLHISYICLDRHDARLRLMKSLGFKHTGFYFSKGANCHG